jgi:hypothetical protein
MSIPHILLIALTLLFLCWVGLGVYWIVERKIRFNQINELKKKIFDIEVDRHVLMQEITSEEIRLECLSLRSN